MEGVKTCCREQAMSMSVSKCRFTLQYGFEPKALASGLYNNAETLAEPVPHIGWRPRVEALAVTLRCQADPDGNDQVGDCIADQPPQRKAGIPHHEAADDGQPGN